MYVTIWMHVHQCLLIPAGLQDEELGLALERRAALVVELPQQPLSGDLAVVAAEDQACGGRVMWMVC